MLPALRLLREKYADAVIEVLTITESAAPLRQLPYIDAVHCFRRRAGTLRRIWQTIRVMNLIRKKCFDLAINLQASSGSEILTLCSGARKRLIYPYAYGKWSAFSHVKIAKPRKVQQSVMEDIAALYPLGIREQHASFYYPISERIRKKTSEILRAHGIAPGRYIVIHPGGGASEKQWLAAHYGSLIGAIHEVFALPSVVVLPIRSNSGTHALQQFHHQNRLAWRFPSIYLQVSSSNVSHLSVVIPRHTMLRVPLIYHLLF